MSDIGALCLLFENTFEDYLCVFVKDRIVHHFHANIIMHTPQRFEMIGQTSRRFGECLQTTIGNVRASLKIEDTQFTTVGCNLLWM
jgi:hypothetical protein